MGTMGFSPAAGDPARQFACGDKMVIDIDGDASIRMNLGELNDRPTYEPA